MDMSLFSFLSKLDKGISKPSRFRVSFNLPSGIDLSRASDPFFNPDSTKGEIQRNQQILNANEKINIFCHSATLPQRSFMYFTHKHYGPEYKVPYTQVYEPVTFSFYSDEAMSTRSYFEIWQSAAVNIGTNSMNYYNEFVSDIDIDVLSVEGNPMYSVHLYEAYPLSIGMVDLSYSNANQVSTLTVTMSYRLWKAKNDQTYIKGLPV